MLYEVITRALRRSWAQLIKRIYEVDPLVCPSCGGEMKVIAFIIDHDVHARVVDRPVLDALQHLHAVSRELRAVHPVITSYSIHYTKLYDAKHQEMENAHRVQLLTGLLEPAIIVSYNFV